GADEGQVASAQLAFDGDEAVFLLRLVVADQFCEAVVLDVETLGDGAEVFFRDALRRQIERVRGAVVDNHSPVAVQNTASRSGYRDALDAILFGAAFVELGALDLETPEAGDQQNENADGRVLEYRDLTGGEACVVTQRWLVGVPVFEVWIFGGHSALTYCNREGGLALDRRA